MVKNLKQKKKFFINILVGLVVFSIFLLSMDFTLPTRQARGWVEQIFAPSFGVCGRCNTPWKFTKEHVTGIGVPFDSFAGTVGTGHYTEGVFPLCERCWQELETPEARMPYYRQLWKEWGVDGPQDPRRWDLIEEAVRAGR